jgi:S1-C subfamily serine protease
MKNIKFGVFCLGLLLAITAAVSSLSAQTARVQVEPRARGDRDVFVLDGRGSQLGVMVSDVDIKATTGGVKIDDVNPDSPAEKAGIKAGDVIVEYDGERVRSARQFTRLVQETPEGRAVSIGLLRDGKKQTVNATPESGRMTWNFGPEVDRAMREAERGMREFRFDAMPEFNFRFDDRDRDRGPREPREPRRFEYRLPPDVMPFMNRSRGRLGVTVQSLTRDLEEYFGAKNGGALVSSVTPDSEASKAGVKAGDVIVSLNGKSVRDSDDLIAQLEDVDGEATIVVVRDKKELTLKATIERARPAAPRAGSRPGIVM